MRLEFRGYKGKLYVSKVFSDKNKLINKKRLIENKEALEQFSQFLKKSYTTVELITEEFYLRNAKKNVKTMYLKFSDSNESNYFMLCYVGRQMIIPEIRV